MCSLIFLDSDFVVSFQDGDDEVDYPLAGVPAELFEHNEEPYFSDIDDYDDI